jgi:hypothetical protein
MISASILDVTVIFVFSVILVEVVSSLLLFFFINVVFFAIALVAVIIRVCFQIDIPQICPGLSCKFGILIDNCLEC